MVKYANWDEVVGRFAMGGEAMRIATTGDDVWRPWVVRRGPREAARRQESMTTVSSATVKVYALQIAPGQPMRLAETKPVLWSGTVDAVLSDLRSMADCTAPSLSASRPSCRG